MLARKSKSNHIYAFAEIMVDEIAQLLRYGQKPRLRLSDGSKNR